MFWEADNERDKRKQRFIEVMKRKKCMELLDPLHEKLRALEQGKSSVEDVIKAASHAARKGEVLITDFKKRPDVILAGMAMDENRHLTSIGEIGISVRKACVTEVFSDAIVCPVLAGGTIHESLAKPLEAAGGPSIEKELKSKGALKTGTAVETGPGGLTCAGVIFAAAGDAGAGGAAGSSSGSKAAGDIAAAVLSALAIAEKLDAETVAIPGMAPGGAIDPAAMADAVIGAIKKHEAESVSKIILADMDEETVEAYTEILEKLDDEE